MELESREGGLDMSWMRLVIDSMLEKNFIDLAINFDTISELKMDLRF